MGKPWQDDREIAPKPFDFIPFVTPVEKNSPKGQERYLRDDFVTGRLEFQVVTLSHLFIASGSYMLGEDVGLKDVGVIQSFYRARGVPTVPGSSLKGLVRSIVETVTASCITVTKARREYLPIPESSGRDGCTPQNACPACALFGRKDLMALVRFSDLTAEKEARTIPWRIKPLHNPHPNDAPGVYIADGTERYYKGRKFYHHGTMAVSPNDAPVEVLPQGTKLTGVVRFTNLTPAQVGALCFGLGLDETFALKMGGGKPRCLGSLTIQAQRFVAFNPQNLLRAQLKARIIQGEELSKWIAEHIQTALKKGLLKEEQVALVRQVLQRAGETKECPPDLY